MRICHAELSTAVVVVLLLLLLLLLLLWGVRNKFVVSTPPRELFWLWGESGAGRGG